DARKLLGARVSERAVWADMKARYSELIEDKVEWELAETFFNSLTRRIFATAGVDTNIEYVDSDFAGRERAAPRQLCRVYRAPGLRAIVDAILADSWFDAPYEDAARDAELVAERLTRELEKSGVHARDIEAVELVREPFFRRKGAYLVGRVIGRRTSLPLALALLNRDRGVVVDAVLTDEDDISIVFSFTRSHFHVDVGPAYELVRYLKHLM